jgi:uncharacterized membrane protein YbhN (UPF0104 family)
VKKRWRLLGGGALLAVLAWRLEWGRLGAAFAGLRLGPWLLAVAAYLLAQAVSSRRWQLLAAPLGFGGAWPRYLAHYFVGLFFNLALPTSVGGDVVRAWYLAGAEGRRSAALLSVFADRASGLAVLVALACVAALCSPVPLAPWLAATVAALGAAALLGVAALPLLPALLERAPAGTEKLRRLAEAWRAYLRRPGLLLRVTVLAAGVQAANVVLLWLIGAGLGLAVPFAYYGVLMPLVALLTLLPLSVNGMGLRELGTVALLAPLGVPPEQAVALALLQFAAFAAAGLAGGAFYLFDRLPANEARASLGGAGVEERSDAEPVGGDPDQGRARQPPAAA